MDKYSKNYGPENTPIGIFSNKVEQLVKSYLSENITLEHMYDTLNHFGKVLKTTTRTREMFLTTFTNFCYAIGFEHLKYKNRIVYKATDSKTQKTISNTSEIVKIAHESFGLDSFKNMARGISHPTMLRSRISCFFCYKLTYRDNLNPYLNPHIQYKEEKLWNIT